METFLGVTLVTIAGLGTGSIAWPMKIMRRLEFEHYWFVGMLAGLMIVPWSIVLVGCPNAFQAYAQVGWKPLLISICLRSAGGSPTFCTGYWSSGSGRP